MQSRALGETGAWFDCRGLGELLKMGRTFCYNDIVTVTMIKMEVTPIDNGNYLVEDGILFEGFFL